MPSIRKFDHAFPTFLEVEVNGVPPPNSQPALWHAITSMGLADAIDPSGSVFIVVPGNSIGVALDDVPSIFILPIRHRKSFLDATQGRPVKNGVYRGEINHFDVGMPHSEKFVFQFSGHHVICAKNAKALAAFEHAATWLKPAQVAGTAGGRSPLVAMRMNMKQEAFELRSGITAMIGLRMQLMGGAAKPDPQTLEWEHFADRIINETQTLALTLDVRHGAMLDRLRISPQPGSRLAELIAAQRTMPLNATDALPMHDYMTAFIEAVNWRAVGDYLAPSFGHYVRTKSAKYGKKARNKIWRFPWLLNHAKLGTMVIRSDASSQTHYAACILADMDSRIDMSVMRAHVEELAHFLPSVDSDGIKVGATGPNGLNIHLSKSWAGERAYLINKVGGRRVLMAPTDAFKRLAARVERGPSAASAIDARLQRMMKRYLPSKVIAIDITSARTLEAGAPQAAAGALAFPVHHRPLMVAVSRSGSRLELIFFVPLNMSRHMNPLFSF
ncbi:MAG: hypothetical protein ACP5O1_00080 [Phycisphaerae bacterium]